MIDLLKDKKVIFFDVGYTLDAPRVRRLDVHPSVP